MKTATFQLIALAVVFGLALVYTIHTDRHVTRKANRTETINTLLENDSYRSEVIQALRSQYPAEILETSFLISDHNKAMQSEMMNQMIASCYTNQNMRNMMMGMTMNMCDIDHESCNTLSNMMIHHLSTMECILNTLHEKGLMDNACRNQVLKNIRKESEKINQTDHSTP